jgi:plastocyanin
MTAVNAPACWKNFDGEPHTIRSVDDVFRSGALDQNVSFKFDKPGSNKYVCSIQPQMVATIVVK